MHEVLLVLTVGEALDTIMVRILEVIKILMYITIIYVKPPHPLSMRTSRISLKYNPTTDKQPTLLTPDPPYNPPCPPRQHSPADSPLRDSITFKPSARPDQRTEPSRHVMKNFDVCFATVDNGMQVPVQREKTSGCSILTGEGWHGELYLNSRFINEVCDSRDPNVVFPNVSVDLSPLGIYGREAGVGTHVVATTPDGGEHLLPYAGLCEITNDLFLDFAHVEKGIFICADKDNSHSILSPDIRMKKPLRIKLGQTKWDPMFISVQEGRAIKHHRE